MPSISLRKAFTWMFSLHLFIHLKKGDAPGKGGTEDVYLYSRTYSITLTALFERSCPDRSPRAPVLCSLS